MSGQFIVWKMKSDYIDSLLSAVSIGSVSKGVAHEDIGWNANSEQQVKLLHGNQAPYNTVNASRANLPPHKYLELNSIANDMNSSEQKIRTYATTAEGAWLNNDLDRREGVLKALSKEADAFWKQGQRLDALIMELKKGNVSIEYYQCDNKKVTGNVTDNPYL
jgi:hypothetical protein